MKGQTDFHNICTAYRNVQYKFLSGYEIKHIVKCLNVQIISWFQDKSSLNSFYNGNLISLTNIIVILHKSKL